MKYLLVLLLGIWGCATVDSTGTYVGLSQKQMQQRSDLISNVRYHLQLDLVSDIKIYQGISTIDFDLKKEKDLLVDFFGGKIEQVVANDKIVQYKYDNRKITIKGKNLKEGKNKLVISYSHAYSDNAEGFYRFEDPSDGKSYIYSDFEPFKANELFPCFDQPNLKARYNLTVRAPKDWTVISYDYAKSVVKNDKDKTWIFPESALFSTYILEIAAGPYQVWSDIYVGKNQRKVPLKLYARASLSKFVDANNWFSITKKGISFYEEYFNYPYPFNKYDQIIVPDFNWGGMENVAAVTYNERYIFKSKPTTNQRMSRASVMLHELAHMWFGDLVTMDWWNGLWLNESFATVMSNIALSETTDFENVWQSFFSGTKNWAYWTDQLVTTHPIEVEVADTSTAFTNFDGITYGKGASVLKQLRYLLGDKFESGIQLYFQRHAHKNTKLKDFFKAMEDASGMDLGPWIAEWLETPGLNSVMADYKCEQGKISEFDLKQMAPEKYPTLRTHRTKIGLYKMMDNGLKTYHTLDVTYQGKTTAVEELVGVECPAFVYPNVKDYDYVKSLLDLKSLKTVQNQMSHIQDDFTRQMVWSSLWDMVVDAKLSAKTFYRMALSNLFMENNYKIKTYLIDLLYNKIPPYIFFSNESYLHFEDELADYAWNSLLKSPKGSDYQKEWLNSFLKMANDQEHLRSIEKLLNGSSGIPGLELDQDIRWQMVITLNRRNYKDAQSLLDKEKVADKSAAAQKAIVAALVSRPSLELKKQWYQQIISTKTDKSLAILSEAMNHMFPVEQTKLKEQFASDFYNNLPKLSAFKQAHFLEAFSESMIPTLCNDESSKQIAKFIDQNDKSLPVSVVKSLKVENQENERCVQIVRVINQKNPLNN